MSASRRRERRAKRSCMTIAHNTYKCQSSEEPETARRIAELEAANARLRLMTHITGSLIGASALDEQLREIAGQVCAAFEADACVIRACEEDQLRLLACEGIPHESVYPRIQAGWGIAAEIMQSRRPLVVGDVREHPVTASVINRLPDAYTFLAYAGTPLLVEDRVIGILGLYSRRTQAFTDADAEYLQIVAYHIAVAIANDALYQQVTRQKAQLEQHIAEREWAEEALLQSMEQLQQSLAGTVRAMSSVVEMRDPYTAGHQRRVALLACAIAREIGLPAAHVETLRIAGLLHDIGKIAVPAQILCKPTKLTRPEWSIIQTHPVVGHTILKDTSLPSEVALVALQHHERLDGSGYPDGLCGEEILVTAQILAVADVVEAMVSNRPYRPGLPIQTAIEEITQHKGARYRPEAVDACMKVLAHYEYDLEDLLRREASE